MRNAWRATCVVGSAVALAVTAGVLATGLLPGEALLRQAFLAVASPSMVDVARWVNMGGTWRMLAPGTALLLGLSPAARRRWWLWIGVVVLGPLVGEAWQEVVARARPVGPALGFPSGHATAAATFAVAAVYLLGRAPLPRRLRVALQVLTPLGALAVGLARLVLGAHWPADVVAGFALGAACAAGTAWWDVAHPRPDASPTPGHRRASPHALGAVLLALVVGATAACRERESPGARGAKPRIVASFYPLYEFARQVAGDRAEVRSLIPPGVEPHDWDPAPQDVVHLQKAQVFVYNGLGLEPWAEKLLTDVVGKDTVVVRVTDGLPLIGEGSARRDPHTWLDPVLARAEVEAIRAGLTRADPAGAEAYAEHTRAYGARLAALDQAYEAGLRHCARRDLFTSHAAFAYLARRYRLVQVPLMGLEPEAEPSPTELASLVRLARERKVRYVFFETLVSPKLADTLAREIGARTLVLNPVEGLTEKEQAAGRDYVGVMEENLQHLRTALECR